MAKPAARLSDLNACPITGHGTNPSNSGSGDVNINGMPVLRVGDTTACGDTVTEVQSALQTSQSSVYF
ncbi:PAAR domain-containing protein [Pseudomonas atacamensis]|uniref:PAAR domain-containing protein n=1 Tax=Pseudomonas atacamensis TaxID=2565368 RepID=UPI0021DABF79|nr:PAAR domain-containing protein [Pseudomonas atacamensis]